jgi:phage head maturation protease
MRLYGDIQKVDVEQRMVWGYASTEAMDAHGETVTKTAIEEALAAYLEYANVREMHQLSAVGLTKEASVDDKGLYVGVHVVDDTAWGKVTSGLYKGFSIGGKTLERDPTNRKIITKILLNEISLVDRPSNPEAKFDIWKAAGAQTDVDAAFSAEFWDDTTGKYIAFYEGAWRDPATGNEVLARPALLKVMAERDNLTKTLTNLADRAVATIGNLVAANEDLRKRLATAETPPVRKVVAAGGADRSKVLVDLAVCGKT